MCNKKFSQNSHLQQDMKFHERIYQCARCHKTFVHKYILDADILTHTREGPYECATCEKSFIQKGSLVTHIRIHTGEKLYQRKIYDKKFSNNSNLHQHMKTRTCEICNKKFSQNANLQQHMKFHELKYQCTTCHKNSYINISLMITLLIIIQVNNNGSVAEIVAPP